MHMLKNLNNKFKFTLIFCLSFLCLLFCVFFIQTPIVNAQQSGQGAGSTAVLVDENGVEIGSTTLIVGETITLSPADLHTLVNVNNTGMAKQVVSYKIDDVAYYFSTEIVVPQKIEVEIIEFETKKGASIGIEYYRPIEFVSLKFTTSISQNSYQKLIEKYGEENVTFGTLIMSPMYKDYLYNLEQLSVGSHYLIKKPMFYAGTTTTFYGSLDGAQIEKERLGLGVVSIKLDDVTTARIYATSGDINNHIRVAKTVAEQVYNDKSTVQTGKYVNYINPGWYSKYTREQLNNINAWYNLEYQTLA